MDQMKQRFVNSIASRLSAAPDGTAKAELVEELSDNLYQRFEEMTAAGMDKAAAFDAALDDLGDTGELVDYLKSLAPDEGLPRPEPAPGKDEDQAWSGMDDLLGDVNDIVSAAMEQAGAALSQAKDALKKAAQKGGWRSADGSFELHVDSRDDDHGAHPYDEGHEDVSADEEAPEHQGGVFSYSFGFDKAKGGFFVQRDGWDGESVPAGGLRGIDVQVSGDVTVRLSGDDADEIRLDGDTGKLEVRVTDRGVLAIRQGRTAASSFFFQRGLDAADVELYLPHRRFEFLQVSTASGDVEVERGVETDRLSVRTTSGSLRARPDCCGALYFKSSSGDVEADGLTGTAQADTVSGDIRLDGHLEHAKLHTVSGDVELSGSFQTAELTTVSGDIRTETAILPLSAALTSKSGDCGLRVPDGTPFTVEFRTISGEFRSRLPLTRTSGGALYLGGGENRLTMNSISGDLMLDQF